MNKKILILTHSQDDCAQLVIERLEKRKSNFIRFNTDEFHSKIKVIMRLDEQGKFLGKYQFPDHDLKFEEIGAVWNRRIHKPNIGSELDYEPDLKNWMIDESEWAMNISFTMLRCPVVNPWEINERLKFNKIIQMERAASFGLEIPLTCVTDNLKVIKKFWKEVDQEVIFKKIRKGLFQFKDGKRYLVHTSKIPKEMMSDNNLMRMRFCPVFLQRHIPKKFDIRSVVVDNQIFSVAIYSQNVKEGVVDYRKAAVMGKLKKMPHKPINLGEIINKRLISFTKSFGLTFSVIDLIMTPDDKIVFLEDNPNGQWGWLEHLTNLPISEAFADVLIRLSEKGGEHNGNKIRETVFS